MTLRVEKRGAVGWIVFDQPAKRNAINGAMWRGIAPAIARFEEDPEVRCVAFRGAGTEAFASGADISEFEEIRAQKASVAEYDDLLDQVLHAIQDSRKPSVAMIFGFCMGGGMAIALACDLRFAAEGSRFGIPAARLGIIYDFDAVRQLVDLVGPAHAKDILYSARALRADEAFRIGLIQRLTPAPDLEKETLDYLKTVAANAPLSLRGAKAQMAAIFDGANAMHREQMQTARLETFDSEDYKEGTQAFLEKRPPRFTGR
jgi:enoyl-CoA hydratase/carnithine racemase